jgi:hypothetical protein
MIKMMKFNYYDKQAIKLAFGYIPKDFIKITQEKLHQLQQKQLKNKISKIAEKNEDDYLDFMTDLMKRK